MIKSKIKIVIDGALVPFIVFFGFTIVITIIFCIIYGIENINAMLVQGIANAFAIFPLVILYKNFNKKYNISFDRVYLNKILLIIPLSISICLLANIFIQFLPSAKDNIVSKEIAELTAKYNVGLSFLLVALFVPIVEELLFRGFFYNTIYIMRGSSAAIIITSILFAIAHFNLEQGIYGLIAGLFLAYIRYKFNNIIYTIVMHLIMNFCSLTIVALIIDKNVVTVPMYIVLSCVIIIILIINKIRKMN